MAPDDVSDADPLVELVKQRVADLRARGVVTEDVERRLDAHAERVTGGPEPAGARLREAIASLERAATAGNPGRLAAAAQRLISPALERIAAVAAATAAGLREVADALDDPASHGHPDLQKSIDHLLDRVARLDRLPEGEAALVDLRGRVEALEAAARSATAPPQTRTP